MSSKRTLLISSGILLAMIILLMLLSQRGYYTILDMENVERVDQKRANSLRADKDLLVLDVRSKEEFNVSHLKGAIRYQPEILDTLDQRTSVMVYCTISLRSNSLAKELSDRGHQNVYDITGGLISWLNEDKELINAKGNSTDSVHTYNRWFSILLNEGTAVY